MLLLRFEAALAQLVEHRIRNAIRGECISIEY